MSWPRLLLTSFGLGHCRPAPGTWGSLPPPALVLLLLVLGASRWTIDVVLVLVCLLFSAVTVRFGHLAESLWNRKDPRQVVSDEVAGQSVALLALPWLPLADGRSALYDAGVIAMAFVAFRIMDIVKPPPANQLQALSGGWGILIDDLIAGVYALILVQIASRLILNASLCPHFSPPSAAAV